MAQQLIGGRYRLLDLIATGGFGEVWRARDERLRALVAIKRIRIGSYVSAAERAELIARAEREARHAAALRQEPNVVAVYDVVTEDGLPWVVMRLVEGGSLAEELRRRTRLEPERAFEIALGVLAALGAAHRNGIVHRDVKPANIMLAADGQVLLADFGIAKHRDDTSLTSTGMVVGSIEYMAPERFGAAPNADGPAGDLFSLGATLFETVEGISPFRRTSVTATMAAVAFEPHPPLRHAGPLAALIQRLLVKNPAERPGVGEAIRILRGLSAQPTVVAEQQWESIDVGVAAGGDDEYDVILESAGTKKIQVIKVIRELTPLGLKESKNLVDAAPKLVLAAVDTRVATRAVAALNAVGATASLRPAGRAWGLDPRTSVDVVLETAGSKKIQVIMVIRELTSLGLKEAKDLADGAPRLVLEGVAPNVAAGAVSALQAVGATVSVRTGRRG
ncbi:ribosomal protein L7/L12 [Actinospica durhamensis]|uniref:non-specific serine/threonine protein kinase n=1 Tax=Actinospica durhamensis TaxID=1508375 RepID=A0A941IS85_9ACTN|nr:ribosomal protein L7/L12 [Actinospica durhamensis]MBR7838214.1 ribosomal protein L7/L12 [Actinospica durhamensis]